MFGPEVADDQVVVGPAMAEDQSLPLTKAAQMLNMTRRSALRLIHEGKLAATKDDHGQWMVNKTSIRDRLETKNNTGGAIEHVAVDVDDGQGHTWSEDHAPVQQHLLKELIDKIETLTWRNGYHEAQLAERDNGVRGSMERKVALSSLAAMRNGYDKHSWKGAMV